LLQLAAETLEEEGRLIGDWTLPDCNHTCKDKTTSGYKTCYKCLRPEKTRGNLNRVQYLTKILRPHFRQA